MKRSIISVAAGLLLCGASPAFATMTAEALKNECTAEIRDSGDSQQQVLSGVATAFKKGHCTGYIAGFMDANVHVRDGVSEKQIEDAFLKYIEAHSAEGDSAASWVLESSSRAAGLTYKNK